MHAFLGWRISLARPRSSLTLGSVRSSHKMHQPNPRTLTSDRWLPLPTAVRRDPMTTTILGRIDSPGREYRPPYDQGLLRMPSMQMTVSPPALGSVLASSYAQGRDPLAVRSSFMARFLLGVDTAVALLQSVCQSFVFTVQPNKRIYRRPDAAFSSLAKIAGPAPVILDVRRQA